MSVYTDRDGVETDRVEVDIEETARIHLQHSPYRAIRRITCRYQDGVLTLRGRVATFHYKQLAQTAVAEIKGVTQIVNEIEVDAAP